MGELRARGAVPCTLPLEAADERIVAALITSLAMWLIDGGGANGTAVTASQTIKDRSGHR